MITDNHFRYHKGNDAKAAVEILGGPAQVHRPLCPWQYDKDDRFSRLIATELAYRQLFTSNNDRAAALVPWPER